MALIGISTHKQKSFDFRFSFLNELVLPKRYVNRISDSLKEKKIFSNEIEQLIYDINNIELLVKKTPTNHINIISDFLLQKSA